MKWNNFLCFVWEFVSIIQVADKNNCRGRTGIVSNRSECNWSLFLCFSLPHSLVRNLKKKLSFFTSLVWAIMTKFKNRLLCLFLALQRLSHYFQTCYGTDWYIHLPANATFNQSDLISTSILLYHVFILQRYQWFWMNDAFRFAQFWTHAQFACISNRFQWCLQHDLSTISVKIPLEYSWDAFAIEIKWWDERNPDLTL